MLENDEAIIHVQGIGHDVLPIEKDLLNVC
jgi:hypothetical protein